VTAPWSYLLCGTPRTGSTLLCSLLASTGVAGRPESYFREPDEPTWAAQFGVPVARDGSFHYRAFAVGALQAGSTPNGVFAARIMWGTMHPVVDGLRPDGTAETDRDVLADTFGPLRLVHLHRDDVVGQAVSWAHAEQTGYWQHGDVSSREPAIDLDQADELVRTIQAHNAAWSSWFADQGVRPHIVTYEALVADPERTVRTILDHLDVEAPGAWRPAPTHARQADEVNTEWVRRYRSTRL
jgi:LPS sulfotransferase NodH